VFPCYLAQLNGIPSIVEAFVKRLEGLAGKYIFAVCSYGGFGPVNALPTLKNLSSLIRSMGGELSGAFSVRLPLNNLDYDHMPVPVERDQELILRRASRKIEAICLRIIHRKGTRHRRMKSFTGLLLAPMYSMMRKVIEGSLRSAAKEEQGSALGFRELIPLTDKSISVDANCTGCGICADVCPVENIKLIEGKPQWRHRCEMCLACDEWCPRKAIHHWCKSIGKDYHHPGVTIADMISARGPRPKP
jgi:ferredoxin